MSSRRELSKATRRDAILDAAVELLRTRSSDDVATEEIAALAGVSPATVYNLVGTRDDVVHALVDRVMAQLVESLALLDPDDPIAAAQLVVDHTVQAFVADSHVFRQVVAIAQRTAARRQGGVYPSEFQVTAMRRAQALGILRDDIEAAGLARQIFVSYTGAMALWSAGRLDDAGFLITAQHGLFTALAAGAAEAHRPGFLDRLRVLGVALEQEAWRRPGAAD